MFSCEDVINYWRESLAYLDNQYSQEEQSGIHR